MPKTTPHPASFLVDADGAHEHVDEALVKEHLSESEFFWLDLYRPTAADLTMLTDVFAFHPLAVEDAAHFGQRPKLDPFDGFVLLVAYGANEDKDGLVEVHCFYGERFLVTVHRDSCPPFDNLRVRAARDMSPPAKGAMLLYLVVDALADSFFPGLAKLDDRIDELENGVLQKPDDAQLQQIFALKRRLVTWRKVITPERDTFARLVTGVVAIPGMTPDMEHYYRDVYDHLIRISDLVDSYRDLLTGAMDVYLSTISNRLNEVMRRLTIVATIFMPLTWITGFFGMNFGRLVLNITGWPAFLVFGLATQVAAVAVMLVLFRRRGWM
ncbi:MAG TPA: magnesium/cobalt transporter CorA [Thermoleophilia bacterium]|nr:magnesium/cobalt transporter CorA [Thermoleophilia bacterium]